MGKAFVIEDIASQEYKRFAVVEHEQRAAGHGKYLKVWDWYEREDEARARAHSFNHPRTLP